MRIFYLVFIICFSLLPLNPQNLDQFKLLKDQFIYRESHIATALTVNGEPYGIDEVIERGVIKVKESSKDTVTLNIINFYQKKKPAFLKKVMHTVEKTNGTLLMKKNGKHICASGSVGMRSFPIMPEKDLKIGETYFADAGLFLKIQENKLIPDLYLEIRYQYRFLGTEVINGKEISIFNANATVYQERNKNIFQKYSILKVVGFSDALIRFNRSEGLVFSIDEFFDWVIILADTTVVSFDGTVKTSYKTPPPLPVDRLMKIISDKDNHTLALNKDQMLSATIENILFPANSASLGETEKLRIDEVANLLKQFGLNSFIVVGHTADIGDHEGQLELSEERALSVYQYIIHKFQFNPNKISYRGRGGLEPLATNETTEGRARNRRVEFIILPD